MTMIVPLPASSSVAGRASSLLNMLSPPSEVNKRKWTNMDEKPFNQVTRE